MSDRLFFSRQRREFGNDARAPGFLSGWWQLPFSVFAWMALASALWIVAVYLFA